MSLPAKLHTTFLPSELFYLSEDTLITITSHISLAPIELVGLTTPQLRSGRNAEVPLWLAVILKKQVKCAIMLPKWMSEASLKEIYEQEIQDMSAFNDKLPSDWLEISQTLLDVARDDLRSPPHVIRNLLRDIREARQAKARSGISELNESHMRMDNLGLLEINELRPFVAMVMDEIRRIVATMEEDGDNSDNSDDDDYHNYNDGENNRYHNYSQNLNSVQNMENTFNQRDHFPPPSSRSLDESTTNHAQSPHYGNNVLPDLDLSLPEALDTPQQKKRTLHAGSSVQRSAPPSSYARHSHDNNEDRMDNDYDMDEDEDGYSYDLALQRQERERYRREEEQEMDKTKATYSYDDEYDDLYSTPSRPKISKNLLDDTQDIDGSQSENIHTDEDHEMQD